MFRIVAMALFGLAMLAPTPVLAHGGGCKKSSPPGQCCHMEKKVGKEHCH